MQGGENKGAHRLTKGASWRRRWDMLEKQGSGEGKLVVNPIRLEYNKDEEVPG